MTSSKRIEANRRNAKLSTGPRTAIGKPRVRANSIRHGLSSKKRVDPSFAAQVDLLLYRPFVSPLFTKRVLLAKTTWFRRAWRLSRPFTRTQHRIKRIPKASAELKTQSPPCSIPSQRGNRGFARSATPEDQRHPHTTESNAITSNATLTFRAVNFGAPTQHNFQLAWDVPGDSLAIGHTIRTRESQAVARSPLLQPGQSNPAHDQAR
jgi:hypothetical protein